MGRGQSHRRGRSWALGCEVIRRRRVAPNQTGSDTGRSGCACTQIGAQAGRGVVTPRPRRDADRGLRTGRRELNTSKKTRTSSHFSSAAPRSAGRHGRASPCADPRPRPPLAHRRRQARHAYGLAGGTTSYLMISDLTFGFERLEHKVPPPACINTRRWLRSLRRIIPSV